MFHHWHCFFKYILKNNFKRIYENDEKLEWAKTVEKYKSLYNEEVENRTKKYDYWSEINFIFKSKNYKFKSLLFINLLQS